MRLVIIESPYAAATEAERRENVVYAQAAVRDSLERGEAPIASHLLCTQPGILDDDNPNERALGIAAGLAWRTVAGLSAFYTDRGWSKGMRDAYASALKEGRPYALRSIRGALAHPPEGEGG